MLNGHYSAKKYPEHLRRVRFKDPESGKTLIFLTNNSMPLVSDSPIQKRLLKKSIRRPCGSRCRFNRRSLRLDLDKIFIMTSIEQLHHLACEKGEDTYIDPA